MQSSTASTQSIEARMSHLSVVPAKKSNYELANDLEELVKTVPMVEAQRDTIKEAEKRLRYLED